MNIVEVIETYTTPEAAKQLVSEHPPLAIGGPTGSGKGTIAHYLTQSANYSPIVSDTTRAPRKHHAGYEVNGIEYWFINEAVAIEKLQAGEYIEAKWVHQTTLYGTSITSYRRVVAAGRTPLLEIDVQGLEELMNHFPGFEAIFLLPPSFEVWQARLDGRGDMDLEQKLRRLRSAVVEFERVVENPRFHPVVNTEVVDTAELIEHGAYKQPEYRESALAIVRDLQASTQAYLAQHG